MSRVPAAILFACNANAIRSPMAAALFRSLYGTKTYVDSVGVTAGETDPFVTAILAEHGISGFDNHQPKTFDDLLDTSFEVIVALTRPAYDHALELTRTLSCDVLFWPTEDPAMTEGNREIRLEAYRQVFTDLHDRILREWPIAPPTASEPGMPDEHTGTRVTDRKSYGLKERRRGRDLWSRMRMGLRRLRR